MTNNDEHFDPAAGFLEAVESYAFTVVDGSAAFCPVPDPGMAFLVDTGERVFS